MGPVQSFCEPKIFPSDRSEVQRAGVQATRTGPSAEFASYFMAIPIGPWRSVGRSTVG